MSYLLVIFSISFLILGCYTVSKATVIKSTTSILGVALFIYFKNFQTIINDKLLISIFEGLLVASGTAIAIKNNAVSDGLEILGIFINDKFVVSISKVIILFSSVLFSITTFVIFLEIALYSI